jgi:hypothetical protein
MKKNCIWCAIGFIGAIALVYYLGRKGNKITTADLKSDATKLKQTASEKELQKTPINPEIKSPIFVDDLKRGSDNLVGSLKKAYKDIINPGPPQNIDSPEQFQAGADGYHYASGIKTVNLQSACQCVDKTPGYKTGIKLNR